MIPYLHICGERLSSFSLMSSISVLLFFIALMIELKHISAGKDEKIFILPKLVFSGMAALFFSAAADALFKLPQNRGIVISGITFYGGLIGFTVSLYFLLKHCKENTEYSIEQWFDIITVPIIIFHISGRIGCFMAGCCYGKTTTSFLGVKFPDIEEIGIFHNGLKCYPTQLFEVAALIVILMVINRGESKFKRYILLYAIARFLIEFFRGDNRGAQLLGFSPAQIISGLIIILYVFTYLEKIVKPIYNGSDLARNKDR